MDKHTLLKHYFGHQDFRPGQEQLIDALLSGRDVLGVMPTGAGKSICYQIPALMMPGFCVVVSPLISLMKDQVAALDQAGIPAACINSSLSEEEFSQVFRGAWAGEYKLLYVAPERLLTDAFLSLCQQGEISMVAVDEAHCVSQWGQDFRPSYLDIARFLNALPRRPVVGAFTATATVTVKQDIEALLGLQTPFSVTTGFDRPNLYFDVARPKNKNIWLRHFLAQHTDQSGIIYCATRKTVESVCSFLSRNGISATRYHAGLPDEERHQNHEDFVFDRCRVMVATNAFGMGIDKSNVSFVVHYNMPKDLESYYQEAGRAGRDGEKADCVLLYSAGDIQTARILIERSSENEQLSAEDLESVQRCDRARLDQMILYCKTTGCLRAFLLNYFGEPSADRCENCGNCIGEMEEVDITVEAQKIFSGIARAERLHPYGLGINTIVRMLSGSKEQRILELKLDRLPTYGAMAELDQKRIREYIDQLIDQKYLVLTNSEYPVLRMTERVKPVLFQSQPVSYTRRRQTVAETAVAPSKTAKQPLAAENQALFEVLRTKRAEIAAEAGVPAYIVFSNAALADMAAKQPSDMEEFLQVSGVGEVKAERYGEIFLHTINEWLNAQGPSA